MKPAIRTVLALVIGAGLLSACGDKGSSISQPPLPTPTPQPAVSFQSKFGAPFATAFNASATAEPTKPATTDVPALNLTAEPLDN